jgi:hypothetical protein
LIFVAFVSFCSILLTFLISGNQPRRAIARDVIPPPLRQHERIICLSNEIEQKQTKETKKRTLIIEGRASSQISML